MSEQSRFSIAEKVLTYCRCGRDRVDKQPDKWLRLQVRCSSVNENALPCCRRLNTSIPFLYECERWLGGFLSENNQNTSKISTENQPAHDWFRFPSDYKNSGAELTLSLAGGLDGWTNQRSEVVTNAICALFLLSRAPAVARERLKEGGKVTQFLANLSKRGSEVQKKVSDN